MKVVSLAFLFFAIAYSSCGNNETTDIKKAVVNKDSIGFVKGISIIDSLNKYIGTARVLEAGQFDYYVGQLNRTNFALVENTDTSILLYHLIEKKWLVTDTLPHNLLLFDIVDLNGDNYDDLVIVYNIAVNGGNGKNICLLYYPSAKQFRHNKYFDLPNIGYDKKKKLVHSAWWAGADFHLQEKKTYTISGNSLTFKTGVTCIGDYNPSSDEKAISNNATLTFYTMKNGNKIITKKKNGTLKKMLAIFHASLWNTNDQ